MNKKQKKLTEQNRNEQDMIDQNRIKKGYNKIEVNRI